MQMVVIRLIMLANFPFPYCNGGLANDLLSCLGGNFYSLPSLI